jgi:hypothetical protein
MAITEGHPHGTPHDHERVDEEAVDAALADGALQAFGEYACAA